MAEWGKLGCFYRIFTPFFAFLCYSEFRNSGKGEIHVKTGKWRWLLLLPLAALLAGFLAWMYHPRSLTASLRALGGDIQVIISTYEIRVEDHVAYPDGKGYPFIVEAGTEEYDALLELLEGYSWHEQINTLGGDGTINGTGRGDPEVNLGASVYSLSPKCAPSRGVLLINNYKGAPNARVDGNVCQLGWGDANGELLLALAELFGVTNPQASP